MRKMAMMLSISTLSGNDQLNRSSFGSRNINPASLPWPLKGDLNQTDTPQVSLILTLDLY